MAIHPTVTRNQRTMQRQKCRMWLWRLRLLCQRLPGTQPGLEEAWIEGPCIGIQVPQQELAEKAIVENCHQTVTTTRAAIDIEMVATKLLGHLLSMADVRGDGLICQNPLKTGDTTRSKPQSCDPDRQSHLSRT